MVTGKFCAGFGKQRTDLANLGSFLSHRFCKCCYRKVGEIELRFFRQIPCASNVFCLAKFGDIDPSVLQFSETTYNDHFCDNFNRILKLSNEYFNEQFLLSFVNMTFEMYNIKRLKTLTNDYIRRLLFYINLAVFQQLDSVSLFAKLIISMLLQKIKIIRGSTGSTEM